MYGCRGEHRGEDNGWFRGTKAMDDCNQLRTALEGDGGRGASWKRKREREKRRQNDDEREGPTRA